ncbi:MAG: hypothetical protein QM831_17160 [Kofleriaceae bacterium]
MKLLWLCLMASSIAHADDAPEMQLMSAMMRCPAISADGTHVAIYSQAPGSAKDSKTSLAVFSIKGAEEQRLSVVPPATDQKRAASDAGAVTKLLDAGQYKRMGRVKRVDESFKDGKLVTHVESGDASLAIELTGRKLTITGKRGDAKVALSKSLPAKDGACAKADSYSVPNTLAGYDDKTHTFAFSIQVENDKSICHSHDFVVVL